MSTTSRPALSNSRRRFLRSQEQLQLLACHALPSPRSRLRVVGIHAPAAATRTAGARFEPGF